MRFAQIVFSPTGGTQKVADAITEVWGNTVDRVDLSNPGEDFSKVAFEEEALVLAFLRMEAVFRNLPQDGLDRYTAAVRSASLSAYMETGRMRILLWNCRIL